jgi:hypothetical protein
LGCDAFRWGLAEPAHEAGQAYAWIVAGVREWSSSCAPK